MAHTKKIVIHDNGSGDVPSGVDAGQKTPIVAPEPLPTLATDTSAPPPPPPGFGAKPKP